MSDTRPKKVYKVAILIFEGTDIFSFTGPLQILSHASHGEHAFWDESFDVQTVARKELIHAASSLKVEVDLTIDEILDEITNYDILVVPGADIPILQKLIARDSPELHLIRRFTSYDSKRPRMLFSICTGSLLLGAAVHLPGITVTTHERALPTLQDICDRVNNNYKPKPAIVHRRFVDGGLLKESNVRIVSSGGVSSGIDATLFIICRLLSAEVASAISQDMEYGWAEPLDADWPAKFSCSLT